MRFGFKDLMIEGSGLVVVSFGRFNPPTTGHEKVIEKVKTVAGTAPFRVYPSHSVGPKDPLPHTKKIAYMRKMFPKYKKNIVADTSAKTIIHIAEKLYKEGFDEMIMVAGSDRVKEFDTLLQKYNGKADRKGNILYDFKTIKVVNAGQRDPDAEGVEGMSASKMRTAASDSDFDSFKTGIPNTLNDNDKKKLYLDVRKHMGIREAKEMGKLTDFESMRDAYLTGQVWKIGDMIESKGLVGKVINRGTNYLSFVDEDGKVHKSWLHDIVGVGSMTAPTGQIFALKSEEVDEACWDSHKQVGMKKKGDKEVPNCVPKNETTDHRKDYETFVKMYAQLNKAMDDASTKLKKIGSKNRGATGLTDPVVKASPAYKKAKADYEKVSNLTKRFLKGVPKEFLKRNQKTRVVKSEKELSEKWWNDLSTKINQVSHPKGWDKAMKDYADGMQDTENQKHPSAYASEIARQYRGIESRELIKYINRLVSQGKLPKELHAQTEEKEQTTFADLVKEINSNNDWYAYRREAKKGKLK
jgi:hypothetical protein